MPCFGITVLARDEVGTHYRNHTVSARTLEEADALIVDYYARNREMLLEFDQAVLLEDISADGVDRILETQGKVYFGWIRGGPFRMVELNVVGWAALLAPPAMAGGVTSLVVGWHPTVGALAGAGAALVVAVAWDRWRWRNSVVSLSSGVDLEQLRRVAERLRAEGIDVTVDAADPGSVVAPDSDRADVDRWRLTTRQRWVNRVLTALDASAAPPRD